MRRNITSLLYTSAIILKLCVGAPSETDGDVQQENLSTEPGQPPLIPPERAESLPVTNVFIQNVYQAPPVVIPPYSGSSYVAGDPYPIKQVNHGLSTLLHGVKSGDISTILRGSFIFPTDNNVKSVANTVLDSLFGYQQQPYGYANQY